MLRIPKKCILHAEKIADKGTPEYTCSHEYIQYDRASDHDGFIWDIYKSNKFQNADPGDHCYILLMALKPIFEEIFINNGTWRLKPLWWNGDKMQTISINDIPPIVEEYSLELRKRTEHQKLRQILSTPIRWTLDLKMLFVSDTVESNMWPTPYKDEMKIFPHMFRLPWTRKQCRITMTDNFIEALLNDSYWAFKDAISRILHQKRSRIIMVNTPRAMVKFLVRAFDTLVIQPKTQAEIPFIHKRRGLYPVEAYDHGSVFVDVTQYKPSGWYFTEPATTKGKLNIVEIVGITQGQYEHMQHKCNHYHNSYGSRLFVRFNKFTEDFSDEEQRMLVSLSS